MSTLIQWTDITDNIITVKGGGWWCRKISEGCKNCYAAKLNQSDYFGGNHLPYSGEPPELVLHEDIIQGWARMRKPKKHFVASMTDVFGDWVPQKWIFKFLDGMAAAPNQIFQVLTKRADVMCREIIAWLNQQQLDTVPSNIWLGVSAENFKELWRMDELGKIPAQNKFLSMEPLLEGVRLNDAVVANGINWVIIGGESGKQARQCQLKWIDDLVKDCQTAKVACFVKQLGGNLDDYDLSICSEASGKSMAHPKGGDPLEWPAELRVREFPMPF